MNADNSLTVSLEEFGLSKYEARAYYSMVSRGPVSASELAYYAELPRTKVYPTLQKLQKKGLATISQTKPIVCSAIAPEEAFDSVIQEQINKINAMNSLVSGLKTVSEASRKNRGTQEKRYRRLSPGNVAGELRSMMNGARESVLVVADGMGVDLLVQCRKEVTAAMRRGVEVRVVVPPGAAGSERAGTLPACTGVRMAAHHSTSSFVVDGTGILSVGRAGEGDAVQSAESLGSCMTGYFEALWGMGVRADSLLDVTGAESAEAYAAVAALEGGGMARALEHSGTGTPPDMAGLLEDGGVPVHSKTLSDLVDLADAALQSACLGHARLDLAGGEIYLESPPGAGHVPAWSLVLESYLGRRGYRTRMIPQKSPGTEKVRIRLEKE